MNIVPDIILVFVIAVSFISGYKKGLVRSIWKIIAMSVTTALVIALKSPAVAFVSGSRIADKLYNTIYNAVNIPTGGGVNITESLNLPYFMQSEIDLGLQNAAGAVTDAAALKLTNLVITIGTCIILFVIIRIVLMSAFMIADTVSKMPIIKTANRILGGLLSVINILFAVFLVLALITMFAPASSKVFDAVNNSYIVSYLYNYNIILQLFMKF